MENQSNAIETHLNELMEKIEDTDLSPKQYLEKDIELLYSIGNKYFSIKNYPDAQTFFTRLVIARPNDLLFWSKLGYCRQYTNDFEGAILAWGMCANIDRENYFYHLLSAECFISLKLIDEAFHCYDYVNKQKIEDPATIRKMEQIDLLLKEVKIGK